MIDHVTLLTFKCIPIGYINVSRSDEVNLMSWSMTRNSTWSKHDLRWWRDCGVMFFEAHFSAIPGNLSLVLRKFLKHSGTAWGWNRQFLLFIRKTKSKKHLEKKDFENAWKVSRFFAFFYDAFLVYLQCLEEIFKTVIKSCSGGCC